MLTFLCCGLNGLGLRPWTIVVRPSGPVCTGLRAMDYPCDRLYMVILVLSDNSVVRRPTFLFGLSYCSFVYLRLTLSPTCSIVLVASHPGVSTPFVLRHMLYAHATVLSLRLRACVLGTVIISCSLPRTLDLRLRACVLDSLRCDHRLDARRIPLLLSARRCVSARLLLSAR